MLPFITHLQKYNNQPINFLFSESTKELQDILKKSAVYYSDAADSYVKVRMDHDLQGIE